MRIHTPPPLVPVYTLKGPTSSLSLPSHFDQAESSKGSGKKDVTRLEVVIVQVQFSVPAQVNIKELRKKSKNQMFW